MINKPNYRLNASKMLQQLIEQISGPILDVGCHDGQMTAPLSVNRQLFRVDANLSVFLENEPNSCCARGEALPFLDNSMELVIFSDVLEHLAEMAGDKCLDEICRVSARQIYLQVPNSEHLASGNVLCPHCGFSGHYCGHKRSLNSEMLIIAMEKRGFKPLIQVATGDDSAIAVDDFVINCYQQAGESMLVNVSCPVCQETIFSKSQGLKNWLDGQWRRRLYAQPINSKIKKSEVGILFSCQEEKKKFFPSMGARIKSLPINHCPKGNIITTDIPQVPLLPMARFLKTNDSSLQTLLLVFPLLIEPASKLLITLNTTIPKGLEVHHTEEGSETKIGKGEMSETGLFTIVIPEKLFYREARFLLQWPASDQLEFDEATLTVDSKMEYRQVIIGGSEEEYLQHETEKIPLGINVLANQYTILPQEFTSSSSAVASEENGSSAVVITVTNARLAQQKWLREQTEIKVEQLQLENQRLQLELEVVKQHQNKLAASQQLFEEKQQLEAELLLLKKEKKLPSVESYIKFIKKLQGIWRKIVAQYRKKK